MRARFLVNRPQDIEELADELAVRWAPLFSPKEAPKFSEKDWRKRLDILHLVLEQLQDDVADLATYAAVVPVLLRRLIESFPKIPITCVAQAHIYANSESTEHRRAAGDWLEQQKRRP